MNSLIYLAGDIDAAIESILVDKKLENTGLTKNKVMKTIKSFQGDLLAASSFLRKYAVRNEQGIITELTLSESKARWAKTIAGVDKGFGGESKNEEYFTGLYDYFLPGGRQMFALGNDYIKKATLSNCYFIGIEEDSIEGIFDAAKKMARTYSYGGGVGTCIGPLRPKDAKVSNTARQSTGAVSFMDLYALVTYLIGQQGRRGALLMSIPVHHPDVLDFIEIKHNNTEAIKSANISVKITDEFMKAVIEDKDFELFFDTSHERISKIVRAKDIWNKIIKSARDSAEPGVLFWDTSVERSPSDRYPRLCIQGVNPCSELILEKSGCCVLGSLLLHKFVKDPFTPKAQFDFSLFGEMVQRGVRHLDNVVELNIDSHPLPEQRETARAGRRIGLGATGLGDMLACLMLKYDSDEAIGFVDQLFSYKAGVEYSYSMDLAKERGSFLLFDPDIHYTKGFAYDLPEELKEKGKALGQRNVSISTIAPSGSISIIAQCTSGIEPMFEERYDRYTELSGRRERFEVVHPGVVRCLKTSGLDKVPDFFIAAHDVDPMCRIKIQAAAQRYIDSSISATVNLPEDVSEETVSNIYIEAWKQKLKGVTVYREGSREGILVSSNKENNPLRGSPDKMDTIAFKFLAEHNNKYHVLVSYREKDITKPYQVFVLNYTATDNDSFVKIGNALVKMLQEKSADQKRIDKHLERSTNSLHKMARFISLGMKLGYVKECYDILDEYAYAGSLAAKLCNILSLSFNAGAKLCPACGSSNVKFTEGCMICKSCGNGACGG